MNREILYNSFNAIDDDILERSEYFAHPKVLSPWMKWIAVASVLCLVIIGVAVWKGGQTVTDGTGTGGTGTGILAGDPTLPGALEIYPTVMVNGKLYEWGEVGYNRDGIPEGSVYYGELTHVEGETPSGDGEFVSVFSVSGQIYTAPQDDTVVYLCLTTEWLDNTVVVFNLVEAED